MARRERRRREEKMGRSVNPIRPSKEFKDIINFVRAKYIMAGRIPPSVANISMVIAKKTDKEEILNDCFIRF